MNQSKKTYSIIIILIITLSSCKNPSDSDNNTDLIKDKGMVLIKAAGKSFQMGSDNGNVDDKPVHTVSFTYDFWIDTTEVTQKDYSDLMKVNYSGYSDPDWKDEYGKGEIYPVYYVNWYDAVLYCNARSKRDNLDTVYSYTSLSGTPGNGCVLNDIEINFDIKGYRLPTEAEWKYACRAGTTTEYYWGSDSTGIKNYSWYNGNSGIKTHEVALKLPNAFGLYDMGGSLWEWCSDWYKEYFYSISPKTDPKGPGDGSFRVLRGGSWNIDARYCRSAGRAAYYPDPRYNNIGFRPVVSW